VGTTEVAIKLGAAKLYEGAERFGFGKTTGVDLPGEAEGILRPLKDWSPGSIAAVPFGQELSCNLLHVARLYAAIANGGRLVTPHVVKSFETMGGHEMGAPQKPSGQRVLSESVREKLLVLLKDVVEEGTGTPTALPGYEVAGKTGTAQKYNEKLHAYTMDDNNSSFVGFVPAEHPKFLCVVMLDNPKGLTLGGWVAGPVFRASMGAMLAESQVPQDPALLAAADKRVATKATRWTLQLSRGQSAQAVAWVKVPAVEGMALGAAKALLLKSGLKARCIGSGKLVKAQFPAKGQELRQFSYVKLLLDSSNTVAMAEKAKRGMD
jgi:membrane peptidoglycan carboxypeptidase